jgi:hypothetical protein
MSGNPNGPPVYGRVPTPLQAKTINWLGRDCDSLAAKNETVIAWLERLEINDGFQETSQSEGPPQLVVPKDAQQKSSTTQKFLAVLSPIPAIRLLIIYIPEFDTGCNSEDPKYFNLSTHPPISMPDYRKVQVPSLRRRLVLQKVSRESITS